MNGENDNVITALTRGSNNTLARSRKRMQSPIYFRRTSNANIRKSFEKSAFNEDMSYYEGNDQEDDEEDLDSKYERMYRAYMSDPNVKASIDAEYDHRYPLAKYNSVIDLDEE